MSKIGLNAALYRGVLGSASVTYTEMCNVRDLTLTDERGTADTSTRCSEIETAETTMRKVTIEFEMLWDEDDADFAFVLAAYLANEATYFKCLSSTDGSGPEGQWKVVKLTRKEGLKDAIMADVSLIPTADMEWVAAS